MLSIDTSLLQGFASPSELSSIQPKINEVYAELLQHRCRGGEFLGWLDLPLKIDTDEIKRITQVAEEIRNKADVFVVIGIGGSYLGARAVIEALRPAFTIDPGETRILYAGHHLSADYMAELLRYLENKSYYLNVISKSGTTTEPGVAFRVLRNHLRKKVAAPSASQCIIATTDRSKGALRQLATAEGYRTFVIPDDVGGRFSVLTPVGLLPIAVAGIDISALLEGAKEMALRCRASSDLSTNLALTYAAARHLLYNKEKTIEVLALFDPYLQYLGEWWKQLFGESEGKDGKGIFPASVTFTTDLHSMGQYLQDGRRHLFETFIITDHCQHELLIPEWEENLDQMNFIANKDIAFVNEQAYRATAQAHHAGGVPNMSIHLERRDAHHLGQLLYFFQFAVAISGLLLGVNPFDQPGVNAYKDNMFKLLGKI